MEARNYDDLLKQQETLETYLLENPKSSLFAWYARQNMEAGELDRALQICKLGIQNVDNKGVIHKLMSEIYVAKGEMTQSMKHLVECILTKEPFPGAILEVVKNLGDTMEADQIAFLVHLLNKALPGHPDATKFYKKYPSARNMVVQPGQYKFLEELSVSLERSAMVEVLDEDETEEVEQAPPAPQPIAATEAVAAPEPIPMPDTTAAPETIPAPEAAQAPPVTPLPEPSPPPVATQTPIATQTPDPIPMPEVIPMTEAASDDAPIKADGVIPGIDPQAVAAVEVIIEDESPKPSPPVDAIDPPQTATGQAGIPPELAEPPKPIEKPAPRQGPAVKHKITRSMATFTLMQIFKDQAMYENALEVLQFLREKSTNLERIENEEQEIRELMAKNGFQ